MGHSYLPNPVCDSLEEPLYLAGVRVNIYPSEGGVRTGARHQADCPGAGTEEQSA